MSQNLSSAAVVIGALRVKYIISYRAIYQTDTDMYWGQNEDSFAYAFLTDILSQLI